MFVWYTLNLDSHTNSTTRQTVRLFMITLRIYIKKHGKFVMFLNNASYHKSAATKKFLAEYGKEIVLIFLPPYTPEINPVEIQWRGIKKGSANRLYKVDEMTKSIKYMLRKDEIKTVKMFDYPTQ